MTATDTPPILQDIHRHLSESELTYSLLGRHTPVASSKALFERFHKDRRTMLSQLGHALAIDGLNVHPEEIIGPATNQVWLSIRVDMGFLNVLDLLRICEHADAYLLSAYDEAMEDAGISVRVKHVLHRQRVRLANELTSLRSLQEDIERSAGS